MSILEGTEKVVQLFGAAERMAPKIEKGVAAAGEAGARLSTEGTDLGLAHLGNRNGLGPSLKLDGVDLAPPAIVSPIADVDRTTMHTIGTRAERPSGMEPVIKADTSEPPAIATVSSERRAALGSATDDPRRNRFRVVGASTAPEGPVASSVEKAERSVDALWRMLTPIDGRPPIDGGVWNFDQPRLYGLPDGKGTVSLRKVEVGEFYGGDVKITLTPANPTKIDGVDGMVTSVEMRDNKDQTGLMYFERGRYLLSSGVYKRSLGGLGASPAPTAYEATILAPSAKPWGMAARGVSGPSPLRAGDHQLYQFDNPAPLETSFGNFLTSKRIWGRTDAAGGRLVNADGSFVHLEEGPNGKPYSPTGQEFPPVVNDLWQDPILRPSRVMQSASVQAPDDARLVRELGRFEELHAPSGAVLRENSIPVETNGLWVHAHLSLPGRANLFHSRTGLYNPTKLRPETVVVDFSNGSTRIIAGHTRENPELDDVLKLLYSAPAPR